MDGESRGGNENEGLTDRISNLPDEIRECILGLLPICNAVRTSVLSQVWRYTWTKADQLNLYFDEYLEKKISKYRYVRRVKHVLSSHVGPIHKCVWHPLWCDIFINKNNESYGDTWLQLLSRKGMTDLTIDFRHFHRGLDYIDLPSCIFKFHGLSRLTLRSCHLDESFVLEDLPNLVSLDLSYVNIYGDILEKATANCQLEMLHVVSCTFYNSNTDLRPHQVVIRAPNLRVLNIVCDYTGLRRDFLPRSEYWMPNRMNCNWFYTLSYIPKIEVLTFDCRLHKTSASNFIPKRLPELLGSLKTVILHDMNPFSVDHLSFLFCIVGSSPILKILNIHMSDLMHGILINGVSLKEAIAYLEAESKEERNTSITTVSLTINGYELEHIRQEILFIRSIVSCCPALENLFIKASYMEDPAKEQLSSALEQLGRSSSKLKIICSNSC